jgi:hypothetical protein
VVAASILNMQINGTSPTSTTGMAANQVGGVTIRQDGGRRLLEAHFVFDKPAPGVLVDGVAILAAHVKGAGDIDAAKLRVDVTGLAPGEYKAICLLGYAADKKIDLDIVVNVDLVPDGSHFSSLHISDNRVPLASVKVGGLIGEVADGGKVDGVTIDNLYI